MFQWVMGHSSFSSNVSQWNKEEPIKMLAQAENDGHISKGTVLVTLNPFTRQQRGLGFENWITVEMQFNPWLTHWVFWSSHVLQSAHHSKTPKAEESKNFLSRNINFFAFTHGSQINVRCDFLYMGLLWKSYSPIQSHLLNKHLQVPPGYKASWEFLSSRGLQSGIGRWTQTTQHMQGPWGYVWIHSGPQAGRHLPDLPEIGQRGALSHLIGSMGSPGKQTPKELLWRKSRD